MTDFKKGDLVEFQQSDPHWDDLVTGDLGIVVVVPKNEDDGPSIQVRFLRHTQDLYMLDKELKKVSKPIIPQL